MRIRVVNHTTDTQNLSVEKQVHQHLSKSLSPEARFDCLYGDVSSLRHDFSKTMEKNSLPNNLPSRTIERETAPTISKHCIASREKHEPTSSPQWRNALVNASTNTLTRLICAFTDASAHTAVLRGYCTDGRPFIGRWRQKEIAS